MTGERWTCAILGKREIPRPICQYLRGANNVKPRQASSILALSMGLLLAAGCASPPAPDPTPIVEAPSEPPVPLPENVTFTGQWKFSGPSVAMGNAQVHEFEIPRNATLRFSVSTNEPTMLTFEVYTRDHEEVFSTRGNFGEPVTGSIELAPGDYEAWAAMGIGALASFTVVLEFAEAIVPTVQ